MNKQDLQKKRENIIIKCEKYDIMPFIIDEISDSLAYLNQYKIANIQDNIDCFIDKIISLNNNYCNSLIIKE